MLPKTLLDDDEYLHFICRGTKLDAVIKICTEQFQYISLVTMMMGRVEKNYGSLN